MRKSRVNHLLFLLAQNEKLLAPGRNRLEVKSLQLNFVQCSLDADLGPKHFENGSKMKSFCQVSVYKIEPHNKVNPRPALIRRLLKQFYYYEELCNSDAPWNIDLSNLGRMTPPKNLILSVLFYREASAPVSTDESNATPSMSRPDLLCSFLLTDERGESCPDGEYTLGLYSFPDGHESAVLRQDELLTYHSWPPSKQPFVNISLKWVNMEPSKMGVDEEEEVENFFPYSLLQSVHKFSNICPSPTSADSFVPDKTTQIPPYRFDCSLLTPINFSYSIFPYQTKPAVQFYFHYGQGLSNLMDIRNDYVCPWCLRQQYTPTALLCHLQHSHDRFTFVDQLDRINNVVHIDVSLNYSYCDLEDFHIEAQRIIPKNFIFVHTNSDIVKDRIINRNNTPIPIKKRAYYHSRTCMPLLPSEIDIDSEDDVGNEWLHEKIDNMIDEFLDVNDGEKSLMKLWNRHVLTYRYLTIKDIHNCCIQFCERYWEVIIRNNLRNNLALHLATLYHFNLIPSGTISICLYFVDHLYESFLKLQKLSGNSCYPSYGSESATGIATATNSAGASNAPAPVDVQITTPSTLM